MNGKDVDLIWESYVTASPVLLVENEFPEDAKRKYMQVYNQLEDLIAQKMQEYPEISKQDAIDVSVEDLESHYNNQEDYEAAAMLTDIHVKYAGLNKEETDTTGEEPGRVFVLVSRNTYSSGNQPLGVYSTLEEAEEAQAAKGNYVGGDQPDVSITQIYSIVMGQPPSDKAATIANVHSEGTGSTDHEFDAPHRVADREKFENDPGYQQLQQKMQSQYDEEKLLNYWKSWHKRSFYNVQDGGSPVHFDRDMLPDENHKHYDEIKDIRDDIGRMTHMYNSQY